MENMMTVKPAGFWIRFIAALIDGIIVAIPTMIINFVINFMVNAAAHGSPSKAFSAFSFIIEMVIGILISLAYHAYFYQSTGATPGKKVMNLKVIDAQTGNLLTFGQTFMREVIGKTVDAFTLLIGYIMAGVRSDKRALHDLIAGSRVIELPHPTVSIPLQPTQPIQPNSLV